MNRKSGISFGGVTAVAGVGFTVSRHFVLSPQVMSKPALTLANPAGTGFVTFSPNNKLIATAHHGHPTLIRDVKTGKVISRLENSQSTYRLTFLPYGLTIIGIGNSNNVQFWEVATGRQKAAFKGHDGRVRPGDWKIIRNTNEPGHWPKK